MVDQPHLKALIEALASEEAWERADYDRLLGLAVPDRVAAGLTWAPLQLESVLPAGRGRAVARLRTAPGSVLHDGIGSGDPVRLGPLSSPDAGPDGQCVGVDERVAEVLVEAGYDAAGPLALTRRFDGTTYQRYRAALVRAAGHASPLRDVLLGTRTPGQRPPELPDSPRFDRLNADQRHAARLALSTPQVGLVQGPPGTGKTTLLVALLQAFVDREERPWALADSNAAVDNLAVHAHRAGLDVVRLGHPARIGSEATALSLDHRVAHGSYGEVLHNLDRELIKLHGSRGPTHQDRRSLLRERDEIAARARRAVLESAQVIASTLGTLARVAADLPRPVTAVLDEATQATEPAVWVAVPWVSRLVLVGDPHQLGPVVMEPGNPLQVSLLDRLIAQDALRMPMLTVQHRMHRDIEALVQPVYGGRLQAHPSVAGHLLRDLDGVADNALTGAAVRFVDTAGAGMDEQLDPVSQSLYNPGEAEVVARAVRQLRASGLVPDAIGVITPYSAQVGCLSEQSDLEGVEVHTVNAFQGREKEAIVCSFVRSNHDATLGFLADDRRLTVALSRARRLLVCVGDSATLAGHPRFGALLDAVGRSGALRTVWEPPWDGS